MEDYNNEIIPQPSWWKRNWKWALPAGGCLTLILVIIAVVGFGAFKVVQNVKENTKYDEVIAKVQTHQEVIDALGS